MSAVVTSLPLPPIYYCGATKNYYRAEFRGRWIAFNEGSAVRFIRSQGYGGQDANGLGAVDSCLLRIQSEQNVDYVGPLAGFQAGPREVNGRLVLVTDSPKLIEPAPGEWPLLATLLEGMFNDPAADQRPYVFGWLRRSIEGVREQRWSPGQVLALGGEVNSGKSLFQRIVTELLGGRAAKPYRFLTDRTQFNGDLIGAEHQMVEDEAESIDIRARRHFGAGIKGIAVNRDQQCHGKYREGLVLTPIWRMTISLNNEQERLQVLPPMDSDVADKLMLLWVNRREMPMPTRTAEEQEGFWSALMVEMPHFIHYLLQWQIPPELTCPRFGIAHYHHPTLLEALERTSPENRLLSLMDHLIFNRGDRQDQCGFDGPAEQLEQHLRRADDAFRRQLDQILSFPAACGTYLGRLEKKVGSRVSKRVIHGQTIWTIQPPLCPSAPEGGEGGHVLSHPVAPSSFPNLQASKRTLSSPLPPSQGGEVGQVSHESMRNDEEKRDGMTGPWEVLENLPHLPTLAGPLHPLLRDQEGRCSRRGQATGVLGLPSVSDPGLN